MNSLIKIWDFFSGKKMVIGGYIMTFIVMAQQVDLELPPKLLTVLFIAGGMLMGGGQVHKGIKALEKK